MLYNNNHRPFAAYSLPNQTPRDHRETDDERSRRGFFFIKHYTRYAISTYTLICIYLYIYIFGVDACDSAQCAYNT
jgi:hypothetical protein